jgi:DNA repair protein RAD16
MCGPGKDAFAKLKLLLDCMMLRRTKVMSWRSMRTSLSHICVQLQRAEDLGLPPRTVIVRRNYFSPEEKEIYLSLFSDAKRQFATYVDQGTILNSEYSIYTEIPFLFSHFSDYSNIFSLLTRMRQMACHPDLVLRSRTNANTFVPDDEGETTVCRLCNDIAEDAIQARCRHIFDRECIKQYLQAALEDQVSVLHVDRVTIFDSCVHISPLVLFVI